MPSTGRSLLFVPYALAAPTFRSEDPAAAAIAAVAWRAATACAGREASAAREVPIEIGAVDGGFAGRAFVEGPRQTVWRDARGAITREEETPGVGLVRIRVSRAEGRVIAHEVAHAWVHRGPPALVEGATELLAACIVRRAPGRFGAEERERHLDALEDLRAWENTNEGGASRGAGYAASRRMFQVLAEVVPPAELWRADWTWEAFDAVLANAGPTGAHIAEALAGGVAAQRVAFDDLDGDGVLGVRERLAGTDPTDPGVEDGSWRNGVPEALRAHAVWLGPGRGLACSGRAAGPLGALVWTRAGLGAADEWGDRWPPGVLIDGGYPTARGARGGPPFGGEGGLVAVRPGASIALNAASGEPSWGLVQGVGLVPDTRCWSDARWTVLAARETADSLSAFVGALERVDAVADRHLEPPVSRRSVYLGDHLPPITPFSPTRVPSAWRERGAAEGWDHVAAYVVAAERLGYTPVPDGLVRGPALYEAFARALVPTPGEARLTDADAEEVAAWADLVAACEGGWAALAAGNCG